MSDRQKLVFALLASVFLHLAIGVVLASWTTSHVADVERPQPDLSRLTVTIMPATAPPPVVTPPLHTVRPVLDSDGHTPSAKAPAHPLFQSDANMVAGSALPGSGNIPLPSQAGQQRKFMDFADIPASMGKGQVPSTPSTPAPQPAQSMPAQTPSAITQVQNSPVPFDVAPTPTPIPSPPPDALALGTPTPSPSPTPVQMASLATPPPLTDHLKIPPLPAPPQTQSFPPSPNLPEPSTQRETDKSRINGGINTTGSPGVDAVETPFGRYHRNLSNLIGSRWQLYLQEHPKDVGDVTILVVLDTDGTVAATRVTENHSLDDLAELSTRAIVESHLPPVPDDLAPMLRNGRLEITFNFNVYDPNK